METTAAAESHSIEMHGSSRERQLSKAIYGLVTVLAVIQVLTVHHGSAWSSAVTLFGTTLAVALVDAYSESIAAMLARDHTLTWEELREILHDAAPVLVGSQVPTLVVLLAVAGLVEHETALRLASAAAFLLLFSYGFTVGKMLGGSLLRRIANGFTLVVIGALIVAIKAAFH